MPVSSRTPIAVFDLDGTLVDGQSGSLFSIYLLKHGVINLPRAARLVWWGARYKLHLPQRQDEPREVILAALNRSHPDDIAQIMREFHAEEMVPRYRQSMIEEVKRRKEEGCVTLLASATFHEVAEAAVEYLGMDGFVATEMERDITGSYTGFVQGEVTEGREKLNAVVRWADAQLGQGNWYLSHAYGDHISDVPLLTIARQAVAVCPSYLMKFVALRYNWAILEFGN
jgi:HAD superfamily hydrolase (TIGR01490 family)